jgi:hypothetical protein
MSNASPTKHNTASKRECYIVSFRPRNAGLYSAEKTKSCKVLVHSFIAVTSSTYVVSSCDRNTVLEWMPAHVENLLVEVDLVGIGLFPHALTLPNRPSSRATGSRTALLA